MSIERVSVLFLSQEDVIKCGVMDMRMIIDEIERLFLLHYSGETISPPKLSLRWGDIESESIRGRFNAMPGYIGSSVNIAGIKWVGSKPLNPKRYGLPRASAIIVLNDPETALPLAIMDGTIISAMRTGAVSGIALKYLSPSEADALAVIGAGVQSRTQLMALMHVCPSIRKVRVFDIYPERAKSFVDEGIRKYGEISFEAVSSPKEAVKDADVVITVTTAMKPIVRSEWVKRGALLINVGNHEYESRVVLESDKVVVDDLEAVIHRGVQTVAVMLKEGIISREDIYAELGEIVGGAKKGRENPAETIFFSAVGMGIEDLIVAKKIYDTALKKGIGTELVLWERPVWV